MTASNALFIDISINSFIIIFLEFTKLVKN